MQKVKPPICPRCGAERPSLTQSCDGCQDPERSTDWIEVGSRLNDSRRTETVIRMIRGGIMLAAGVVVAVMVRQNSSMNSIFGALIVGLIGAGLWELWRGRNELGVLAQNSSWRFADADQRLTAQIESKYGDWFGSGHRVVDEHPALDESLRALTFTPATLKAWMAQLDSIRPYMWNSVELRWSLVLLHLAATGRIALTVQANHRWTRTHPRSPPSPSVERRLAFRLLQSEPPLENPMHAAVLSILAARKPSADGSACSTGELLYSIKGDPTNHRPWLQGMYALSPKLADDDQTPADESIALSLGTLAVLRQLYVEIGIIVDDD